MSSVTSSPLPLAPLGHSTLIQKKIDAAAVSLSVDIIDSNNDTTSPPTTQGTVESSMSRPCSSLFLAVPFPFVHGQKVFFAAQGSCSRKHVALNNAVIYHLCMDQKGGSLIEV